MNLGLEAILDEIIGNLTLKTEHSIGIQGILRVGKRPSQPDI